MARNPQTTKLRDQVVRLFNQGYSQTEIGTALGITRGAAGRLIAEARKAGVETVRYTNEQKVRRMHDAIQATLGEEGHHEMFAKAGRERQAAYRARLGDTAYMAEMTRRISIARQAKREKNQAAVPAE